MKKHQQILVDIEIDKLTNSIENSISGDVFDTEIFQLFSKDDKQIVNADWQFNWKEQIKLSNRETFKLAIKDNPKIIQGLRLCNEIIFTKYSLLYNSIHHEIHLF